VNLQKLPDGAIVRGADLNRLIDAIRQETRIVAGPGLNVHWSSVGKVLSLTSNPLANNAAAGGNWPIPEHGISYIFFGRITGIDAEKSTTLNNAWVYDFEEVRQRGIGYDVENPALQWTHYGCVGQARNVIENMGATTGVQGNGVDISGSSWPTGFSIQPAPTGVIVVMYRVGSGDSARYWFQYENAVDGECE